MTILLTVLLGMAAGVASGLFGIGGGIIIVPMVGFLYGFNQQGAVATSLVALLLPVGSLGVWQYYRSGFIDASHLKIGLLIAGGIFIGTFLGTKLAVHLSSQVLTKMFSVFLIVIALRLWWTASQS